VRGLGGRACKSTTSYSPCVDRMRVRR
jgi:hypothetical protein